MPKISKAIFFCAICAGLILVASFTHAQILGAPNVQTNAAKNISNYQATISGYFGVSYISSTANNTDGVCDRKVIAKPPYERMRRTLHQIDRGDWFVCDRKLIAFA